MPAYNEAEVIGSILDRVCAIKEVDENIAVENGSSDGTPAAVAAHTGVRLVRHPYNIGNGAAVKSGIRAAKGEIIILMDADGQHPPEEIPNLLQHIGEYDMVVGARNSESEAQQ